MLTFTPKPAKYETLGDLFRKIEKEQKSKDKSGGKGEVKESGVFRTARQVLESHKKEKQAKIGDFFGRKGVVEEESEVKAEIMGEKKNRDLKSLFGDESDEEDAMKVEDEGSRDKKRKHEDKHKKQPEKKQKTGELSESSMDKEYEKFVEAVENSKNNERKSEQVNSNNSEKKNEQNGHSSKVKKNRLKKTEIGNLVVKLLTPAYVERRFESRDTFKSTARNISHALIDKGRINFTILYMY